MSIEKVIGLILVLVMFGLLVWFLVVKSSAPTEGILSLSPQECDVKGKGISLLQFEKKIAESASTSPEQAMDLYAVYLSCKKKSGYFESDQLAVHDPIIASCAKVAFVNRAEYFNKNAKIASNTAMAQAWNDEYKQVEKVYKALFGESISTSALPACNVKIS